MTKVESMPPQIYSINLQLPLRMGSVNCYLVQGDSGFLLIDSGMPGSRKALLQALERLGCWPGQLKLILITHGDFDHTGCAAYLRRAFDAKIAMHRDDSGMAEQGDMFFNRQPRNALLRKLAPALIGFGKAQRFTPDVLLGRATSSRPTASPPACSPSPGTPKARSAS